VPRRRVVRADPFGIAVFSADPVEAPTVIGQVDGRVRMLRWRPDGRVLAVTEQGGIVDVRSHETYGSDLAVIAVSGDGSLLLLDHPLRLHDLGAGSDRVVDDSVAAVRDGAFAEDGRSFAVATGTSLAVFDVPSGRRPRRDPRVPRQRRRPGGRRRSPALPRRHSPGGPRPPVVTGDSGAPDGSPEGDRIVEEYSLADGHPLYQATEPCRAGAFSPDATRLALAHEGTVVVTPSQIAADVLTRARRHVFRPLTPEDRRSYALDRITGSRRAVTAR
jgi:dipeptidyl aminopeptidase/acylaminoacyl peptidase